MAHHVVWFDIPVLDLERAIAFYSNVLAVDIEKTVPGMPMGVFAFGEGEVSGCIFQSDEARPSDHGPLLYLNVEGRLDEAVALVEAFGGTVLEPRHQIGPYGFRALVLDSEGNRLALHSD